MGWRPRSRAASADSTTIAAAPIPMIMPCRRRSNGVAASSTTSSVAAAPEARKPAATHGSRFSLVTSSAATTITRRHRPARIQSWANAIAWVVLAHAALICVFGPRAPMISANCECPMDRTRNRNRRSNANPSVSIRWRRSAILRSISSTAGSSPRIRDRTASRAMQLLAAAPVGVVPGQVCGEVSRNRGRLKRRSHRCRRAARRADPTARAGWSRGSLSCSASPAGCRRRAARRTRRRWPGGSRRPARRRGPGRCRTR